MGWWGGLGVTVCECMCGFVLCLQVLICVCDYLCVCVRVAEVRRN